MVGQVPLFDKSDIDDLAGFHPGLANGGGSSLRVESSSMLGQ